MKKSIITQAQKNLQDSYPELESMRLRSENYSIISSIASIIGVLVFIIILCFGNFLASMLSILGMVLYFLILQKYTLPRLEYKKYFDSIKSKYIEILLKQIDDSFEYHDGVIPVVDVNDSELFGTGDMSVQGRNYFKGNYKGIKIQVSEIDRIVSLHMSTSVLLIVEFNNVLKSKTFIYDKSHYTDDPEYSPVVSPTGNRVKSENDDFERAFRTTSLDETEAHCILTPKFTESLLSLKEYVNNSKIYVSFCNHKFSILISNRSLFEPVLYESMEDNETFVRFYKEIFYVLKLINLLNLIKNEKK